MRPSEGVFKGSGTEVGENCWRSRWNCSLLNVSIIVNNVVVRPTKRDGLEVLLRLYCLFDILTASRRTRTVLEVIKRGLRDSRRGHYSLTYPLPCLNL